jgi:hypothetical protein
MTAKRFFAFGLALYVVLSLTDLALTYLIVHKGIGHESNPVAEAWLHRHGWQGLAVFKALSVVVFGATVVVIARHRPRTADALVVLGCAALLFVITHSWRMIDEAGRQPTPGQIPVEGPLSRRLPVPDAIDATDPAPLARTPRPLPPPGG